MIEITSQHRDQMINITSLIAKHIREQGYIDGVIVLFVRHTTAALTINENADPDVVTDLLVTLDKKIPWRDNYRHAEGNSAAHLKTSLMGSSETVIVRNGALQLGTWQGIYFCEFDGPRRRQVDLQWLPATV
ncbi:secondary thiamine-phosphate synthase enzyme YjbQ [uncultured Desulfuromonas sp.]|uniref:secondary thiamine-phosphate synthase enzyme YjbQ n=1 Tax=uncultured Desulfuromonas sp. TaxID=181013 RepID=UPI002AAAE99A|nr:secondary thiamine-phosphate synthase enzyme YjbQ [uncultured Desulfuromonas sp.]